MFDVFCHIIDVVLVLLSQLGDDVVGVGRLQVDLDVFSEDGVFGFLLYVLDAIELACFELMSQLCLLVLQINLPILTFGSVLVLYVEEITGLKATQTLEFQSVLSQVGSQGFNHFDL